jgi:hypothetical protein
LDLIYTEEDEFWKHKSKLDWILQGDLNTNFFHKIANNRYKKNFIFSLEIDNQVTYDQEQIRTFIISYYKALLGIETSRFVTLNADLWDNNEKLTINQNTNLELNFTIEEIKKLSFKQMGTSHQDQMVYPFISTKITGN